MSASFSVGELQVFSPHLDDAVFSCGELLAAHPGAEVLTVFAAAPDDFAELTGWDAAGGFHSAAAAIAARRREDVEALAILSAHAVHLDFCDSQYAATPSRQILIERLDAILRQRSANTVLLPAGLFHSDHLLLHEALMVLRSAHAEQQWLLYEDALYRRIPGLLQQRLAQLSLRGECATPLDFPSGERVQAMKRKAVRCYGSQLQALERAANGHADVQRPERYWLLGNAVANNPASQA